MLDDKNDLKLFRECISNCNAAATLCNIRKSKDYHSNRIIRLATLASFMFMQKAFILLCFQAKIKEKKRHEPLLPRTTCRITNSRTNNYLYTPMKVATR